MKRLRVAVLASGSGRSFANLAQLAAAGSLPVDLVLLVASRAGIGAIDHARAAGVPVQVCKAVEVTGALDAVRPDLVIMAGYLSYWALPAHYEARTLNIHPSLLPLFGGRGFFGHHVHEAVLASGMRVSGCTVHLVTAEYDRGPIILQRACPVADDDTAETLAARVFQLELSALPDAVRLFAAGRIVVADGRARILPP